MKNNISQLQKTYIQFLKEFISFKTVSTDKAFKDDIKKAVSWISHMCTSHGFSVSLLQGSHTNPVVFASYIANKKAKTVLVYGHYDVQPADKSDGWSTDPFVLTKKKDRYIARGAVDNKGQILAHMTAVFDAIKNKTLQYNVKFLIEGNEESGNPDLLGLLKKYKEKLHSDFIMISDGEMVGIHPTLDVSFRGGGNMRIEYRTADNDRHSGLFGGAIPNAAVELATMISKLKTNNIVTLSGFYEGVTCADIETKRQHQKISRLQPIKKLAGVKELKTEEGLSPCEQIGLRPTLEVSGFFSGYVGEGYKNIVPAKAEARINVRTVHGQSTAKVMHILKEFVLKETPKYVDVLVHTESHGNPVSLDVDHDHIHEVKKVLKDVHKKEVLHKTVGGSIPVVGQFASVFNKTPIAMVSLCNEDCNMHGVDENFTEYHMTKALEFAKKYWNTPEV